MLSIYKRIIIKRLLEEEEDDDLLLYYAIKNKRRKSTSLLYKTRDAEGSFSLLIKNHLLFEEDMFRMYFRLNKTQFYYVSSLLEKNMPKKGKITTQQKLSLTLRFMATGESYASLSFAYRISSSYITTIVKEVLQHLKKILIPLLMPMPTKNKFKRISDEFWEKWQFPNCVGAIDGKHIRMKAPQNSGSLFFNYKEYFSIVLLAIADANCKFIAVDIGSYGKEGDSGIFKKSTMGKKIIQGDFNFPEPKCLPGSTERLPRFLLGDEAFAIDTYMMKPYAKKVARQDKTKDIFNYRLCHARRVSENAFGLLCQIFRILYTPIAISPKTCTDLILVACCLHNMLRDGFLESTQKPLYHWNPDEEIPSNIISLNRGGGFANFRGFQIRIKLTQYFMTEYGSVEWQEEHVNRRN